MDNKTFRHYLAESARTYKYRIKLAGEVSQTFFDQFETNLARFDLIKMSEPKKTPIMAKLDGFPGTIQNQEMYIFDIELNYPANEEQIRQMAVSLGKSPDSVVIQTPKHSDANVSDAEEAAKNTIEGSSLLQSDYDGPTPEQKAASDEYAKGQTTAAQNSKSIEYKFAGKIAEPAKTTNDIPQGKESPLSSVKRPPKPATGSLPEKA